MSKSRVRKRSNYFWGLIFLIVLTGLLFIYLKASSISTKIPNTEAYDAIYFNAGLGKSNEVVEKSISQLIPKVISQYKKQGWEIDMQGEEVSGVGFLRFLKGKDVVSVSLISRGKYRTEIITEKGMLNEKGWLIDKEF